MTLAYLTSYDMRCLANGERAKLRPLIVSRPSRLVPMPSAGKVQRINQALTLLTRSNHHEL